MSKYKLYRITTGFLFIFLFFIFSLYYSCNYILESDTERYFYHHLEFSGNIFLFGPEFFIGALIWISKLFSQDFFFFLLLNFLIWLPLMFVLGFKSLDAPEFILVFLFFLTPYFYQNAMFLIRQYNSLIFFIYYILLGDHKIKWLFGALSVGSHLYAALLYVLSSSYSVKVLSSARIRLSILFVALCFYFFNPGYVFNAVIYIAKPITGHFYFLDRKLETIALDELDRGDYLSSAVVFFVIVSMFLLSLLHNLKFSNTWSRLIAVMFWSGIFIMLFSVHPIIANRVGFATYFFSIPLFMTCFYLLRRQLLKIKVF